MHPILFEIGGFQLHTYGALGATGFLVLAFIALRRARALGHSPESIADLIFWTALVALLGSRLLFVWQNPEVVETWTDVVNYRKGGLVFYGALLSGVPFASGWLWFRGMPVLGIWDVFATAMPIGHAITRIGCFSAGCCYGLPSGAPWAVEYTHPLSGAPHGIGLHPVQLYEAGGLFVVGAIVTLLYQRRTFDGQALGAYLLLYAALRFVTELYRGDVSRGFFMPELLGELLSYSQGISGIVALAGLLVLGTGRALASKEPS